MAQLGLGTRCVQAGYSPKNGEPRRSHHPEHHVQIREQRRNGPAVRSGGQRLVFYSRLQNPTRDDAVAARIAQRLRQHSRHADMTRAGRIFFAVFNIVGAGDHLVDCGLGACDRGWSSQYQVFSNENKSRNLFPASFQRASSLSRFSEADAEAVFDVNHMNGAVYLLSPQTEVRRWR